MTNTKQRPKRRRDLKAAEAVETEPDAWERFTAATAKIALPRRPKPKDNDEPAGS